MAWGDAEETEDALGDPPKPSTSCFDPLPDGKYFRAKLVALGAALDVASEADRRLLVRFTPCSGTGVSIADRQAG